MSNQETLNPRRFTTTIRHQKEFLASLPTKERFSELETDDRRRYLSRAIAASALSHAERLEKEHGEYDLDANLFALVGKLGSFYENKTLLRDWEEEFDSPRQMPSKTKREFYQAKETVTDFNHTLREVINAGAAHFGFDELLTFMTNMHVAANGPETARDFQTKAREVLVGMRNEIAFEQVLIAGGIDYELGTVEQDATGGDFIIEGVPIDVKAAARTAQRKQEKARQAGRNPDLIVWSHINPSDYEGKLTLPYHKNAEVLARLQPDLQRAIRSFDAEVAV